MPSEATTIACKEGRSALLKRSNRLDHWNPAVWLFGFIVETTLAIAISYLSKRYFEAYFLGLKSRFLSLSTPVENWFFRIFGEGTG
jgi:hypothetical protein